MTPTPTTVRADERRAAAFGISGVPFYVIDEQYGVSGAQDPAVFLGALEQAWAESHPLTLVGAPAAETREAVTMAAARSRQARWMTTVPFVSSRDKCSGISVFYVAQTKPRKTHAELELSSDFSAGVVRWLPAQLLHQAAPSTASAGRSPRR